MSVKKRSKSAKTAPPEPVCRAFAGLGGYSQSGKVKLR
jgi:hypothetical protein